ncbi:MAG: HIT domain-containing protein [Kiloniellales bacterium]|nr:HIT domain-containing protein [Kiloniellales bacterium]
MEFIEGEKEAGCIFCTRLARQNDREDLILHRADHCAVFLNKYPYSHGHLMVVPRQHTDSLGELSAETSAEIMTQLAAWSDLMRNKMKAEGFNVGVNLGKAAGAGIEHHVHFHLVPRWVGDTNFMPMLAETKVLSEALLATYDKLKAAKPVGS